MENLSQNNIIQLTEWITEEERIRLASKSLFHFINYTFKRKQGYQANWHNEVICNTLDNFLSDISFDRLMIFAPPRHGKSEIVSRRFPAYAFGRNPNLEIIACSYGATLAKRMNRDVQRIMDSPEYCEVFPGSKLSGSNVVTQAGKYLRNSEILEIVDHTGVYVNAGVGGAITGMGMDLGIIDDPIKNQKEANSQVVRDAAWEWFISTFHTRAEKDAKILITLTRWHEDDIAGRLLKQMEEDPEAERWRILNFPAIFEGKNKYTPPEDKREIGQALWPWKYDLKKLNQKKKTLGSQTFNAMYQGNPAPADGNIFKRHWWKFYRERPSRFDEIIQSWDCTFKETKDSDYVVGQVWGRVKADKYLLDQVRDRMSFPSTIQALSSLSSKWSQARRKYIEDKANGPAVIDTLKRKISGLIPVTPDGGKVVRANAVSGDIEAGNVYLPDPSIAPWIHDFIEEFSAFPNGANDDQVDCATQALNKLYRSNDTEDDEEDYVGGYQIQH